MLAWGEWYVNAALPPCWLAPTLQRSMASVASTGSAGATPASRVKALFGGPSTGHADRRRKALLKAQARRRQAARQARSGRAGGGQGGGSGGAWCEGQGPSWARSQPSRHMPADAETGSNVSTSAPGAAHASGGGEGASKKARREARFNAKRKRFAEALQVPEWMVALPSDLGCAVPDSLAAASALGDVAASLALAPDSEEEEEEEGWFVAPRPAGKACLLLTTGDCTIAHDKNGMTMHKFSSPLPGGGAEGGDCTVDSGVRSGGRVAARQGGRGGGGGGPPSHRRCAMDAVYDPASRTYYVWDVATWGGMDLSGAPAAFRLAWLAAKWGEDVVTPLLARNAAQQGARRRGRASKRGAFAAKWGGGGGHPTLHVPHRFVRFEDRALAPADQPAPLAVAPLQWAHADPAGLRHAYSGAAASRDGLLFLHACGGREPGVTPLALVWRDAQCSPWAAAPASPSGHTATLSHRPDGALVTREGAVMGHVAPPPPTPSLVRVHFTALHHEAWAEAVGGGDAPPPSSSTPPVLHGMSPPQPVHGRRLLPDSASKLLFLVAAQAGAGVTWAQLAERVASNHAATAPPVDLVAGLDVGGAGVTPPQPPSPPRPIFITHPTLQQDQALAQAASAAAASAHAASLAAAATGPSPTRADKQGGGTAAPRATRRGHANHGAGAFSIAALAGALARGEVACADPPSAPAPVNLFSVQPGK